jgi:hypothetical protein
MNKSLILIAALFATIAYAIGQSCTDYNTNISFCKSTFDSLNYQVNSAVYNSTTQAALDNSAQTQYNSLVTNFGGSVNSTCTNAITKALCLNSIPRCLSSSQPALFACPSLCSDAQSSCPSGFFTGGSPASSFCSGTSNNCYNGNAAGHIKASLLLIAACAIIAMLV